MQNTLWKKDDDILRVLECHDDEVLVIDCKKLTMPTWKGIEALDGYIRCEDELDPKQYGFRDMDVLSPEAISDMHKRFTAVASILPFLSNERERSRMIALAAKQLSISKHTVRNYPVTGIGKGAFRSNKSASEVHLPGTLTSIEEQAFFGCSKLRQLYIPKSVIKIVGNPFAGCNTLTEIKAEPGNTRYQTIDGVLYDTDPIDPYIVCYPAGKPNPSYEMPAGVHYVGEYTFFGNSHLQKVVLCNDVGAIKAEAFAECAALREIVIPDSVHRIEALAFFRCKSLEEIQLPDSIEELGTWSFAECDDLARVRLSKNLTNFSIGVFRDCDKLQKLVIPQGVKNLVIDDHMGLPPGEEKVIQVPPSVEWVSNENGWQGGGYTFCVPRSRRRLWSYWTFAKQDVRYRVKQNELVRGRMTLRKQAKWWFWKLKWCISKLLHRWASSPWGGYKVVTIKDEESENVDKND